jgi:hypothetical protein
MISFVKRSEEIQGKEGFLAENLGWNRQLAPWWATPSLEI